MPGRRGGRRKQLLGAENILEIERGSIRPHSEVFALKEAVDLS